MAQLSPQVLGSLFVAFYNSQGYGGTHGVLNPKQRSKNSTSIFAAKQNL
jgi:restriction endonuclease Mrr